MAVEGEGDVDGLVAEKPLHELGMDALQGLFFVLLALKRDDIARFTGWVTMVEAWITCTIPAYLLLTGVLPLGG